MPFMAVNSLAGDSLSIGVWYLRVMWGPCCAEIAFESWLTLILMAGVRRNLRRRSRPKRTSMGTRGLEITRCDILLLMVVPYIVLASNAARCVFTGREGRAGTIIAWPKIGVGVLEALRIVAQGSMLAGAAVAAEGIHVVILAPASICHPGSEARWRHVIYDTVSDNLGSGGEGGVGVVDKGSDLIGEAPRAKIHQPIGEKSARHRSTPLTKVLVSECFTEVA